MDLVKLLPPNLRDNRWGDIAKVSQEELLELKTALIDPIRSKFIRRNMTDDELKDAIFYLGWNMVQAEGYTNTRRFLEKELQTIVQRARAKTTVEAYPYVFYLLNLIGIVYPLLLENDGILVPWFNFFTVQETDQENFKLDEGRTLDQGLINIIVINKNSLDDGRTLDGGFILDKFVSVFGEPPDKPAWKLDDPSVKGTLSRHFLLSYEFQFAESSQEFMSVNTARVFFNEVLQVKSKVEIPHFQPKLNLRATFDSFLAITDYLTEEGDKIAEQKSIYFTSDLNDVAQVQFGNGTYETVDLNIREVNSLVQKFDLPDLKINAKFTSLFDIETFITINNRFFDFSEIALLDIDDNILFYSTFPIVRYFPRMLSSIRVAVSLES